MERLQGPINSCYIGEQLDVDLECCSLGQEFVRIQEEGDQEGDYYYSHAPSYFSSGNSLLVDDKMPFLQMLQTVELPPFFPLKEPSFQALLKLQPIKRPCWEDISFNPTSVTDVLEAETVVSTSTHDMADPLQCSSPPIKSEIFDLQNAPSIVLSISQEQGPKWLQDPTSHCTDETQPPDSWCHQQNAVTEPSPPISFAREKRKRKRTIPTKNKEEAESQRMTHIAVERNRRRLMNEHLSSLRALMPPYYVQRGDQASIVGGAIDFVKELEQLLQSLEAQKRIRKTEEASTSSNSYPTLTTSTWFPQRPAAGPFWHINSQIPVGDGVQVRRRSEVAETEVTVIQNHVNLKVYCQRRPSQLLRAVVALEELRLTILHLNITSSHTRVLYTFNLKMEEECKLGSADEVAGAVHQIFSIINGS